MGIKMCESCGPTLHEVRWHNGTTWCQACFNAEGWDWNVMNCKRCGLTFDTFTRETTAGTSLCLGYNDHVWPELNEPQPTQYESAQPCGCDPGAKWVCQWHQIERRIEEQQEHG